MSLEQILKVLLDLTNETLAAAIVVMAASLLLYNLSRNLRDRVARTSAILLFCVTFTYLCDTLISLNPTLGTYASVLRLQWVGIAFMPAAMFHLSDALLATTGLPSRGRRRRVVRLLYILSAVFLIFAAFGDWLIQPVAEGAVVSLRAKPLFFVYVAYFLVAAVVSFNFVSRARQRCLTRDTRRRMAYLQFALLTPAVGIFPFSVVLGPGQEFTLPGLLLVSIANVVVILMLLFLAYPLSFFGSRVPDRVVKVELLRFLMRGPATGMLALATIIFFTPASTRVFGIKGQSFLPFAVVAVVLLWQWFTALALPILERRLVYNSDDYDQLARLQQVSERLLTATDLIQLLEAILAATCDYLRVNTAYVATLDDAPELVAAVGPARPSAALILDDAAALAELLEHDTESDPPVRSWRSYWIAPLHSHRAGEQAERAVLLGFLGVQARAAEIDLKLDEIHMLRNFIRRAEQTLDDLALQNEINAALEGLLPQLSLTRTSAADVEFKPGRTPVADPAVVPDREQFIEQVKAALKHYWGGPGLSSSRLLELGVVQRVLADNENNPTRALRDVLLKAIENQRPTSERKLDNPEWVIYNILDLRFIQKIKARDAARRLHMSEPDLYRKQRYAIEAVADTLLEMEHSNGNGSTPGSGNSVLPADTPDSEPLKPAAAD